MTLQKWLDAGEWTYAVRQRYQADMYQLRNGLVIDGDASCVDLDKLLPFEMKEDPGKQFDLSMWIDSDVVFTPQDFENTYRALMAYPDADMVTGFYMMNSEDRRSVVGYFGTEENNYMTDYILQDAVREFGENETDESGQKYDLMPVDFSGFGWVLIKTKVFDSMTYPYFESRPTKRKNVKTFPTSDIFFFKKAKELGFKLFAHPRVILGHEKMVVLR